MLLLSIQQRLAISRINSITRKAYKEVENIFANMPSGILLISTIPAICVPLFLINLGCIIIVIINIANCTRNIQMDRVGFCNVFAKMVIFNDENKS